MEYTVENKTLGTALTVARYAIMVCIYVGFSAIIYSIFTIQHPKGPEFTIPISVTMQCVINLTVQFFFVYGMIWVCVTLKEFTGFEWALLTQTMENAKGTIMFCPMLAILFVGTRMRALQLTDNKGAPQGYVQDGMYMATWSLLIQFLMCLIMPVFTNKRYDPDTLDGSQKATEEPISNYWGAMAVTVLRYFALLALLGGVTTVTIGVFMMTPETANGRGSIPVIADGTLPVSVSEPVGINDVPGAKSAMKNVGETVGAGADVVDNAGDTVTAPVADVTAGAAEAVTGF